VTAWPPVPRRHSAQKLRSALSISPVAHSRTISPDHAGPISPTIEHVGLKQAVSDADWSPNVRLLTNNDQSRTSDLFDSLVQPIIALPSSLGGLKYNPESVDGDDIWPIPTSRWAFRAMWIAQVTTPVRRFARLAAYRLLGAPIRSDWKRRDCEPGDRSPPRAVVAFG